MYKVTFVLFAAIILLFPSATIQANGHILVPTSDCDEYIKITADVTSITVTPRAGLSSSFNDPAGIGDAEIFVFYSFAQFGHDSQYTDQGGLLIDKIYIGDWDVNLYDSYPNKSHKLPEHPKYEHIMCYDLLEQYESRMLHGIFGASEIDSHTFTWSQAGGYVKSYVTGKLAERAALSVGAGPVGVAYSVASTIKDVAELAGNAFLWLFMNNQNLGTIEFGIDLADEDNWNKAYSYTTIAPEDEKGDSVLAIKNWGTVTVGFQLNVESLAQDCIKVDEEGKVEQISVQPQSYNFLVDQQNIQPTIPSWIKNVSEIWANGMLSDAEFANTIEYLISNGIIKSENIQISDDVAPTESKPVVSSYLTISGSEFVKSKTSPVPVKITGELTSVKRGIPAELIIEKPDGTDMAQALVPNNAGNISHTWNIYNAEPVGDYTVILKYDGETLDTTGFSIIGDTPAADVQIPGWIKGNAGLWVKGQIDDTTFTSGLEYLIKDDIIKSPKIKIISPDEHEIVDTTPEFSADIKITTEKPVVDEFVRFMPEVTGDGEFTYKWDFGDGKTSIQEKGLNKYAESGTYKVKLTVTDDTGKPVFANTSVTIAGDGTETSSPIITNSTMPDPFTVNIKTIKDQFLVNESIRFDSEIDEDGNYKYLWDFGDDTSKDTSIASHSYDKTGTYDVKLTATSDSGYNSTSTVSIKIVKTIVDDAPKEDDPVKPDPEPETPEPETPEPETPEPIIDNSDVLTEPSEGDVPNPQPFFPQDKNSNLISITEKSILYYPAHKSSKYDKINQYQIYRADVSWTLTTDDGTIPKGVAWAYVDDLKGDEPTLQYLGVKHANVEGDRLISAPIVDGVATFVFEDTYHSQIQYDHVDYLFEDFAFDGTIQLQKIDVASPYGAIFPPDTCLTELSIEKLPERPVIATSISEPKVISEHQTYYHVWWNFVYPDGSDANASFRVLYQENGNPFHNLVSTGGRMNSSFPLYVECDRTYNLEIADVEIQTDGYYSGGNVPVTVNLSCID